MLYCTVKFSPDADLVLVPAFRKQLLHLHNDNINKAMINISKFNVISNRGVELYDNVNAVFCPLMALYTSDTMTRCLLSDHMSMKEQCSVPVCGTGTVVSPGCYRPVEHRGTSSSVRS